MKDVKKNGKEKREEKNEGLLKLLIIIRPIIQYNE